MEKEYNYINNSPIHLPPKGRRLLGQGVKYMENLQQQKINEKLKKSKVNELWISR